MARGPRAKVRTLGGEIHIKQPCDQLKKDGARCGCPSVKGKTYCNRHRPDGESTPHQGVRAREVDLRLARINRVEADLNTKLLKVNKALLDPTNLLGEIKTARVLIRNVLELCTRQQEDGTLKIIDPLAVGDILDQLHKLAQIVKIQVDNVNSTLVTKVQVAQFKMVLTGLFQKYVPAGQLRPCLEDLQRAMQDMEETVDGQEEV